jgi:RNA polymerase sigma-70 factor (ECF subfamily)
MQEQDLIARSQTGDLDAFNRLVELYQTQVFNLAFRIVGSMGPAEDAAQESFISAFRAIYTFRGGSFRGWLMRIVTNAAYDQLRAVQRRRTRRSRRRSRLPSVARRQPFQRSGSHGSPWRSPPEP